MPYPFCLLDERIQYWISMLGFLEPTEIQRLSIEPILRGESVLLVSPTGSGKTEAAVFPLLHRILKEEKRDCVKLLYVNPLKALTRDLTERLRRIADLLGLKVRPLYGDVSKAFRTPVPDIVIITPESFEIILDWAPSWWPYFKAIKYVVVDEVHELIFSKRGYQLLVLLERLKHLSGNNLQRVCLSATVCNADLVAEFFGGSDGKLKVIQASQERAHKFDVKLATPLSQEETENPFLAGARAIFESLNGKKSLIFVGSRYSAERLKAELERFGINVGVHHGSIGLGEREISEDAFKKGDLKALVATKTLELGIDIGDVEQVIQYRSPGQVIALIQRAGRSMHKPGEESLCKIVSTDPEDFLECLALVNLFDSGFLERPTILDKPLDVLAKEILGYALHNYSGRKRYGRAFTSINLESIYAVIIRCFPFKSLSEGEFIEVVKTLVEDGLLTLEKNAPFPGPKFWRVWKFKEDEVTAWPSLNFREFFTMIPKREVFEVWVDFGFGKLKKVGELDSFFVYRSLATGMVIRLAGFDWKVVEIDERNHIVYVTETKGGGEVPAWRGEGPQRDYAIAKEMLSIIDRLIKGKVALSPAGEDAVKILNEYVNKVDKVFVDSLLNGKIVVEYCPNERTWIFITFLGERINRSLASAIYEKIAESSLLVKYVVSPIGFAFKSEVINPLSALRSIRSNEEFMDLVWRHIKTASPFTRLIKDQISEHFGFPSNEVLLEREAAKQAKEVYYDLEGALEVFKRIISGHMVEEVVAEFSQLGQSILYYPFERSWLASPSLIVREALKHYPSGTLDEILEYLWGNPIEVKEEMRKLTKEIDIVAFLDLDLKGWSIALVPLEEEWATIRVPVATRYFVIRSDDDLKKVQEELERTKFPLNELMGHVVEVTFTRIEDGVEEPYDLKVTKVFDIVLTNIVSSRIMKNTRKIDLKVHVKGTNVTIKHYGVPTAVLTLLIRRDMVTILNLLKQGIVSGKRNVIFELP